MQVIKLTCACTCTSHLHVHVFFDRMKLIAEMVASLQLVYYWRTWKEEEEEEEEGLSSYKYCIFKRYEVHVQCTM